MPNVFEGFKIFREHFIVFALAVLLYFPPLIAGIHLRGWDAPTHIFMASSYQNSWWNQIEPRWYGGYSRFSYPPLAHQLVASIGIVFPNLEIAYAIVLFAFVFLGSQAVRAFCQCFFDKSVSTVSASIFLLLPSLQSMIFSFGQFAGLLASIFALFAASYMYRYIESGNWRHLMATIGFVGCTASTHTNTLFFFLPGACIATLAAAVASSGGIGRVNRIVTIGFISIVMTLISIIPFWTWFLDYRVQTPIPHPSRTNIFQDMDIARIYFFELHGFTLLVSPLALAVFGKARAVFTLTLLYCVYFLLGLGGSTPLPQLLFSSQWEWLTYERFAYWSTLLLLPILSKFLLEFKIEMIRLVTLGLLVLYVTNGIRDPNARLITPPQVDLSAITTIMSENPNCKERFLALGFGYQLPEISVASGAATLDGLWHTVRRDELLRLSGVGALGDALAWSTGRTTLIAFLDRRDPIPANCIFVNETNFWRRQYWSILSEAGWQLISRSTETISYWLPSKQITVPMSIERPQPMPSILSIAWGVIPFLILGVTVSAVVLSRRGRSPV